MTDDEQAYDIPPSEAEPFEIGGLLDEDEVPLEEQMQKANMPEEAITGFVVLLGKDGHWVANSNLELAQYVIKEREADFPDFASGCQTVSVSAVTTMAVQATVGNILNNVGQAVVRAQLETAGQLAQQEQNRKILDDVAKGGKNIPGMGPGMPASFKGRR